MNPAAVASLEKAWQPGPCQPRGPWKARGRFSLGVVGLVKNQALPGRQHLVDVSHVECFSWILKTFPGMQQCGQRCNLRELLPYFLCPLPSF